MRAEFNNPFTAEGNWYKGNLHTHTTNSDGNLSPADTVKQYREAGYHFLALTDHNLLTKLEESPSMLLIPGEECTCGLTEAKDSYHLVALNISQAIPPLGEDGEKIDPQEFVERAKAQGGEIILAHPRYSALTRNDVFSFQGFIGIEAFNTYCSVSGGAYGLDQWDELLARGRNVFGLAVDDAHNRGGVDNPNDACCSWIMVKAKRLTTPDIMDSIRKGLFYASWGPEIRGVRIEGTSISVATSPVKSISFVAPTGYAKKFPVRGRAAILDATLEVHPGPSYVRIECTDGEGRSAWTNAIFLA